MAHMKDLKRVHLVGIGGINMSGLAKLLVRAGIQVSGSDAAASLLTKELLRKGIKVQIGHAAEHIPPDTDLVIYSSAVPEQNPERAEARHRNIDQRNNFQFLGQWTADDRTLVVCGTHGKSTTTALAGLFLIQGGLDPTVIVGSRVPSFAEGNVRFGQSDLFVIEGDEYERHFLEFHPTAVILNNIELDHTDIFPDVATMSDAFRALLHQVKDGGLVIANADDPRVGTLIGEERSRLESRGVKIKTFGFGSHADVQIIDHVIRPGEQTFAWRDELGLVSRLSLHVPGRMNAMNAAGAIALATSFGVTLDIIRPVLASFHGIWRRFEKVAEAGGITVISDYAHHPTAIAATIEAAKQWYPGRRIVVCFQPHHRNRTKQLFFDFIPAFDKADVVIFMEVYDVTGREQKEDEAVSSRDLLEAVVRHDTERGITRPLEYAANPQEGLAALHRHRSSGDVIIVMGAGDIFEIATEIIKT